jgi:ubiquinone biosynthesis protein
MFFIRRPKQNFKRLGEVQSVFMRYGFQFLFQSPSKSRTKKFFEGTENEDPRYRQLSMPERLRLMLTELGPTYIKMGQVISSRSDILPPEYVAELSKLQDDVAPFPFEQVRRVVESELKRPLEAVYLDFDPQPMAAASIGQVHRATLWDGTPVVVKVQRPNIQPMVMADIEIIRTLVKMIEAANDWARRYRVIDFFEEFAKTITWEMDYLNEASNADHLRRIVVDHPHVRVPEMYWNYTTARVLTMERVEGIKISQTDQLDAAGVDRKELAYHFTMSVMIQLIIEGFFHGDPHPGNLYVEPETQTLVYLDMGMMGRLVPTSREQLQDLILSLVRRDSEDVTRIVLQIGTPFRKVNERSLLLSIDHIINRYLEVSLDQLSFSALVQEILATVFRHNIRLPGEFSLAMKTLVQGEEVARQLDPQISLVEVVESVSQKVLKHMFSKDQIVDDFRDMARDVVRMKNVVPRAIETILDQMSNGKFTVAMDIPRFKWIVDTLIVVSNRLVAGLIITGMLIASALVVNVSETGSYARIIRIMGMVGLGTAISLGSFLVLSVLLEIFRTERHKRDVQEDD